MFNAYDMALPLVMAPVLARVFSGPRGSPAWRYTAIALSYSISIVARPLGSAFAGYFGDKVGRSHPVTLTMAGVGAMSLTSAFLPTYAQIGSWAYLLFCFTRFLMGCCFGGEYTAGHTLAIEHAPRELRGAVGGFIQSGFPLGYVLASLVFALIARTVGEAAMFAFGWRIVFATGLMPLLLALRIRRMLPESPEFQRAQIEETLDNAPLVNLFTPPRIYVFLQIFFLMTGLVVADYSIYGFLPSILTLNGHGFGTTTYSLLYSLSLFAAAVGYNLYGRLSDKIGRKSLAIVYCVFLICLGVPTFWLLYRAAVTHNLPLAIVGTVSAASLKIVWGIMPAYLVERFSTKHRSVGVGFGYSSGLILGAWFSIYVWQIHRVPLVAGIEGENMWLSPALLLVLGGVTALISLLFAPERKSLELSEVTD